MGYYAPGDTSKRTDSKLWVYDSEVVFGAGGGLTHNIYLHGLALFLFVRSIS
jgi:hypothetical protein